MFHCLRLKQGAKINIVLRRNFSDRGVSDHGYIADPIFCRVQGLITAARRLEAIIGAPLMGRVMHSGGLDTYREHCRSRRPAGAYKMRKRRVKKGNGGGSGLERTRLCRFPCLTGKKPGLLAIFD